MLVWLLATWVSVHAASSTPAPSLSSTAQSRPTATVDDASATALLKAFPKQPLARRRIVDLFSHSSDAFLQRNATALVKLAVADDDDGVSSDILMLLVERIPADRWRRPQLKGNARRLQSIFEKPRGASDAFAALLFGRCYKPAKRPLDILLKRSVSDFYYSNEGYRGARAALLEWGEGAFPLFEKALMAKSQAGAARRLIAEVAEVHGVKARPLAKALRAARALVSAQEQQGYDDALQSVDPRPWAEVTDNCVAAAATSMLQAQRRCEWWVVQNVNALEPSTALVDFLLKRAEERGARSDLWSTLARLTPGAERPRVTERLVTHLNDVGGGDAAMGLTRLGSTGENALTTTLADDSTPERARALRNVLGILPQLKPPPPPWRVLIEKLLIGSKDGAVRRSAAEALVFYGPDALPAFDRALLQEEDRLVIKSSIEALGKIGAAALPALVRQLKTDPQLVAKTIAQLGPKAAAVAPKLRPYLTAGYDVVFALPQLGPPGIDVLREALFDEDEAVRAAALSGLKSTKFRGALSTETSEDVCRVLYDNSRKLVDGAMDLLLDQPIDRLGACKQDLFEVLSQRNAIKVRALYLLSKMTLDKEEHTTVVDALRKEGGPSAGSGIDPYVLRAAFALKMKERETWTKNALAHDRKARRKNLAAISGAATLGLRDAETIEILAALLQDDASYVRSEAAKALIRLKVKEHLVAAWLVLEAQHNDFGFFQPPDL